jgi:hypothetical protein
MNLQPLFTTSRVITAIYRIASTSLLLIYLVNRVRQGRKISRSAGRKRIVESYIEPH